MARILAFSSQVARGHVGLTAAVPALQRLGHEVWAVPTIILSNHPGHPHVAGAPIAPDVIERVVGALEVNGWLGEVDAVLSGYLPTPEHVHAVGRIVRRMRHRRSFLFCCDPVLGDDPKGVYLDVHAATALRGDLLPLADVATPNRFELGWLAGQPVRTLSEAVAAARTLPCADVFVTSALRQGGQLTNLHIGITGVESCHVSALDIAPHGTGDLFAGLVLGHLLNGISAGEAMARAARGVAVALAASAGQDELSIVPMLDEITAAPAVRLDPL